MPQSQGSFEVGGKVEKWVRTCNTLDLVYIHECLWTSCPPLGSWVYFNILGASSWEIYECRVLEIEYLWWRRCLFGNLWPIIVLPWSFIAHADSLTYFRAHNGRITANNMMWILIDFLVFLHLHLHFVFSWLTNIFHFPPNWLQFCCSLWCVWFFTFSMHMCISCLSPRLTLTHLAPHTVQ